MSNHTHLCQTDTDGTRSDFMRRFHALLAKIMNKKLSRGENFWSPNQPGSTWLLEPQKILDTLLYLWLNGFEHYPLEEVVAFFEKCIADAEETMKIARRKKNKKVKGMEKCEDLKLQSCPRKTVKMFTKNPRFASTKSVLIGAAVEGLKSFWRLYKRRLEGLKEGSRARFPAGTIQIINRFYLNCLPISTNFHPMKYEPYLI